MAYESKQAILEEAGLSHVVTQETPSGLVNGSNAVFTLAHIPLTDSNYDDDVTVADVTAYVNGASVTVSSINATTGQVTLQAAPGNGTAVTISYRYSSITDDAVERVREESSDLVDQGLTSSKFDRPATSGTIRKIVRYYAAGLLLARDYGFQNDTEQTSKDGYKKMELAEAWLAAYVQMLTDQAVHEDAEDDLEPAVETDPAIFAYYDRAEGKYASPSSTITGTTDEFMRNYDE